MNYEVIPIPIPTNDMGIQHFEEWLERVAAKGGELIAIMPTLINNKVLAIFQVHAKGVLAEFKE